ncbi:unannotated protein [freshwater metagenome]|uniref:Unannotated protein n=1 Tax=freshwater metagenome TaxID=449393 RepID=A0A6J6EE26_9ZZZZ
MFKPTSAGDSKFGALIKLNCPLDELIEKRAESVDERIDHVTDSFAVSDAAAL